MGNLDFVDITEVEDCSCEPNVQQMHRQVDLGWETENIFTLAV